MAKKVKSDQVEAAPIKKPVPFIEHPGGTPRFCGNCDHFELPPHEGKKGQCHNMISGSMYVAARDKACSNGFYPDVERFPLHVRMGIVPAKESS